MLEQVARYYAQTLEAHGETPAGVDWNGAHGQNVRFEQLCRVIDPAGRFSLNDVGCGYGALYDFLAERHRDFSYHGCDISAEMVGAARKRHSHHPAASFTQGNRPPEAADYGVASGIFNVRLAHGDGEWGRHLEATLDTLHATSRRGFAFNCLTSYSDAEKMRDYLYYADPLRLFDLCKRRYSRQVALLHDYGLYEFTIIVRKDG